MRNNQINHLETADSIDVENDHTSKPPTHKTFMDGHRTNRIESSHVSDSYINHRLHEYGSFIVSTSASHQVVEPCSCSMSWIDGRKGYGPFTPQSSGCSKYMTTKQMKKHTMRPIHDTEVPNTCMIFCSGASIACHL